ncbi:MAG: hypothetical protein RBR71_14150, partial [Gudongella sp.]|nr:hypothetical protein [Gudongella sp.]
MKLSIKNVKGGKKMLAALFVAMLALVCIASASTLYENDTEVSAVDIQHVSGTLSADAVYAGNVQIDAGKTLTVPAEITITIGAAGIDCTFTVYGTLILKEGAGLVITTGDDMLQLAENGKIEITAEGSKTTVSVADLKSKEYVALFAEITEGPTLSALADDYVIWNVTVLSQGTVTVESTADVFVVAEFLELGSSTEFVIKGGVNVIALMETAGKVTVTKGNLAGLMVSSGEVHVSSGSAFSADLILVGYTGVFTAAAGATLGAVIEDDPDVYILEPAVVSNGVSSVEFYNVKAVSNVTVVNVEDEDDYLRMAGSLKSGGLKDPEGTAMGNEEVVIDDVVVVTESLQIAKDLDLIVGPGAEFVVEEGAVITIADEASFTVSGELFVLGSVVLNGEDSEMTIENFVAVEGDGIISSLNQLNAEVGGVFEAVEYAIQTGTATEPVITYYYVTFANAVGMIPEAVDNTITLKGNVELSEDVDCIIPAEATVDGFTVTVTKDASLIVDEDAEVSTVIESETRYETGEVIVYAGIYKALSDAPSGSVIELMMDAIVARNVTLAEDVTFVFDTGDTLSIINRKADITFTVLGTMDIAAGKTVANGETFLVSGGTVGCAAGGTIQNYYTAVDTTNHAGIITVESGSIESVDPIGYGGVLDFESGEPVINSALYYKGDGGLFEAYVYTDIVSALAAEEMFSFADAFLDAMNITGLQYIVSVLGDIEFVTITVPADVGLLVGAYIIEDIDPFMPVTASLVADVTLLSDSENETLSAIVFMGESSFIGDVVMDLYCGVATFGTNAEILGVFEYGENNVIVSGTYDGQIVAADEKYDGFGVYGDEVNFEGVPAGIAVSGYLDDGLMAAEGNIALWLQVSEDAAFSMESGQLYVLDLTLLGENASAYLGTPATSLSATALAIYGVNGGVITPGEGIVLVYADAAFGSASSGTAVTAGGIGSGAAKIVFVFGANVYVTEYSASGMKAILMVPEIDGYSFVGWYKNPDQTEIFSANNPAYFGSVSEAYGFLVVATFQVTFQYAEGVEYYVDGSLVSGPVYLDVGAHSFTVKVLDGYSGTPVAKTSG